MKHLYQLLISLAILLVPVLSPAQEIIVDHNCIDISKIPYSYIEKAQQDFRMSYGHTSHGSQLIAGATLVMQVFPGQYEFSDEGNGMYIRDRYPGGDLGNPDRTTWAQRTRDMLENNTYEVNMVMWSWCGQASTASEEDINTYLNLMDQLEQDFPDITFIYMTGHLNGTGVEGNLNIRNNQIRGFCRENDKILFDFADIESYDPDGNYFLDKRANDGCYYYIGSDRYNWAEEWCAANPDDCHTCSCAHSHGLNCWMKGQAFWWLMARIAGWDGQSSSDPDVQFSLSSNSFDDTEINGQSEITMEIENTGSEPLVVEMSIECEHEDIFTISDSFGFPMTLGVGESAMIPIYFNPTAEMVYTATINIYINNAETPYEYNISGIGHNIGVNEQDFGFKCFIAPNPVKSASGYLYINKLSGDIENYTVQIVDLLGKVCHSTNINCIDEARYDIGQLKLMPGMYYVTISGGQKIYSLPLVIGN